MDTCDRHRKKNPKESANFLSLLFFGWMVPIFWKGARHGLKMTDLYDPLKSDESERLGDLLEKEWKKELIKCEKELSAEKTGKSGVKRRPSLTWAITRVFWASYMLQGLFLCIQAVFLWVIQSVLQGWVIRHFEPDERCTTVDQVLVQATLLVIVNFGIVFITHHTLLRSCQIGMCVRVACCSIIYRKILRLDQASLNNRAVGTPANLMSNDVARFDILPMYLHYIWIMPIQILVIGYVMWEVAGFGGIIGTGAMIIQTIPIQLYLSTLSAKLRSKIAVYTDKRIQLLSEIISGIQVVKMYSWEKPFEMIVSNVRELEMKLIRHTSHLRGFCAAATALSGRISLFLTLLAIVLMGHHVTAESTFVVLGLFSALKITCAMCFPQGMIMAGEAAVSLDRLTDFLLLHEVQYQGKFETSSNNGPQKVKKPATVRQIEHGVAIQMVRVSANWVHGELPPVLYEVSMEVRSQSLCAIVGPVGSGKSSLLQLMMAELPQRAGTLSLFTGENSQTKITTRDIRISYASQDPWLFSASIRDNILFGEPYDESRYQEVTKVCALLKDFEQMPQGDLTSVGDRGSSLSGGQRARVNLARAVYREADLYLLDDPLSAVDAHVGRHLFEECITGFLEGKTRILVTHQLQYLRQSDTVVVINRGTVERQGSYEELTKSNYYIIDSKNSEATDEIENIEESHEKVLDFKITSVTSVENDQLSEATKHAEVNVEAMAIGSVSYEVYRRYFLAGGNTCLLIFIAVVFVVSQVALSGTDYWMMYWINQETLRSASHSDKFIEGNTSYSNGSDDNIYSPESPWFDENGLLCSIMAIYVFSICNIICMLLVAIRSILFIEIIVNASRKIHASLLSNSLQATMRFFNTNPSGRILNRFSKDMGTVDEILPKMMLDTLQMLLFAIGILVMVVVANYWMILPVIVICGVVYLIIKYYLKTSQDIKRLEGIAKSPVFSHVSSTLNGLTTIRSRGAIAEGLMRRKFDRHQDTHTGTWYLSLVASAALGLLIDLISCIFIACVCFSFILIDDGKILPGYVGLAISQSLMLTAIVPFGIRRSTELIAQMTSVERVLQYTKLPKEGPFTSANPPPPTWPSKGSLVIKDVSMRYADNKPLVLKNLNLTIKSNWKVGIVGRTGAGKSSLISALFRLTGDGLKGEILLDGIDTKSIGLHELRTRISIIPQDPILFSTSLRHNLDPFGQYSDAELWQSLREVELGDAVSSLDFHVVGGGANFSVGQRQLICLARTILSNNRLLVLDEATANVDRCTDALIQNTIRRRFADRTVLTIAHRLDTIMDNDRVLVLAEGCIVEFGRPHLLLKNREGYLSQMVQQTGMRTAEKLAGIAESAYLLSSEFGEKLNDGIASINKDQTTRL